MESHSNILPIVTASDENYAPYLSVMIQSLLEHVDKKQAIILYVIDDDLSVKSKELLTNLVEVDRKNAKITFVTVDKNIYKDFKISDHITTTAYYRISLPQLFRNYNYDKVLYLDADMVIYDDVSKLYQYDLAGKTVGAVIDPGQAHALERLGVNSTDYYFNSGMLVIDLNRWNENNITEKTIEYLSTNSEKIIFHDQDALNAVLYENWCPLPPRWNMQTSLIFDRYPAPTKEYDEWYLEGRLNPAIVHFTGHDKPWNTLQNHPYQEDYLARLEKSVFAKELSE